MTKIEKLEERLKETNAALLNWARMIDSRESKVTETEAMIAYNARCLVIDNVRAIKENMGKDT